jgi:cob(I)alamin adenosyltransferase
VGRRAERRATELQDRGLLVNSEILKYLNRLSDLVFVLARYEDRHLPTEMVKQDDAS